MKFGVKYEIPYGQQVSEMFQNSKQQNIAFRVSNIAIPLQSSEAVPIKLYLIKLSRRGIRVAFMNNKNKYLRVAKKISKIIAINNFCNRDRNQNQDFKNSIEMELLLLILIRTAQANNEIYRQPKKQTSKNFVNWLLSLNGRATLFSRKIAPNGRLITFVTQTPKCEN